MMGNILDGDAALRQFISTLSDYAIVILDEAGMIVSLNAGACSLKGYAPNEVIGAHFSIFYPQEAIAIGHPNRELEVAKSLGRYEEDGWRVRKDGSRFWAHVVITAIYSESDVIKGFGKIVRDDTERKRAKEQSYSSIKRLELASRTDYLTGLVNRRGLNEELCSVLSRPRRKKFITTVAMMDIDKFKVFNDTYGHQPGDDYLKRAAAVWRSSIREEDFLARFGGEEFILVLKDTMISGAMIVIERLHLRTPAPLTLSIGVAEWDGMEDAERLIGRADNALYQAKETGRNRITVAASLADARERAEYDQ